MGAHPGAAGSGAGTEKRTAIVAYAVATVASAASYFFSAEVNRIWPLAWVAPAPILAIAFSAHLRVAAACSLVALFIGGLGNWPAERAVLPAFAVLLIHAVAAAVGTLVVLQTRRVVHSLRHWTCVFAFPTLVTSVLYLMSRVSPHGTTGNAGYAQLDFLPLVQVAALAGLPAVNFLVNLVPAGLALCWWLRTQRRQALPSLLLPLALLSVVLVFGWVRLAQPNSNGSIRVGLAATNQTVRFFRTQKRDEALPVVQAYAQRAATLAARGAEVVVLPEKFVGVTADYLDEVLNTLAAVARTHGVMLVAGLHLMDDRGSRNRAYVFSSTGEQLLEYDKAFTLPLENVYQRGTDPGLITHADTTFGIAICKDMDFPPYIRRYANAGARIMLVPAWDFGADERLHGHMAVMRAIEGGFALARSAQEGLVTATDHLGRIISEASTSTQPEVLVTADLPIGPGTTLYSRTGDWFAWLNVIAALGFVVVRGRDR